MQKLSTEKNGTLFNLNSRINLSQQIYITEQQTPINKSAIHGNFIWQRTKVNHEKNGK